MTVLSISGAEETSKPSASQALLPFHPKGCFFKKGNLHKEKEEKSDHVPKESKKETKGVKETKEIVEKKKPGKRKNLPEAIRKKYEQN